MDTTITVEHRTVIAPWGGDTTPMDVTATQDGDGLWDVTVRRDGRIATTAVMTGRDRPDVIRRAIESIAHGTGPWALAPRSPWARRLFEHSVTTQKATWRHPNPGRHRR